MIERCETCRYFIDYRRPDDEPDEMNGYCCADLVKGRDNEYGGHWTNHELWCEEWEGGSPVFGEAQSASNVVAEEPPAKTE